MIREYYSSSITNFLNDDDKKVLGFLVRNYEFKLEQTQSDAWFEEIQLLKRVLKNYSGHIFFEYSIPRMGKRIDTLLIIDSVIFILEFKIGSKIYDSYAIDQVWDYALDLKNFHQTSHDKYIAPMLIATLAHEVSTFVGINAQNDKILYPILNNEKSLLASIERVLDLCDGPKIDIDEWKSGSYSPTPTIIEAAMALYKGHTVEEISRTDASAINLTKTSEAISDIISRSRENSEKSICFVTGVPGAGKTLVGLNIATKHIDDKSALYSVFLSGNGPLVAILREALARDKTHHERAKGNTSRLADTRREVKLFIQNVHNFRDECLIDTEKPPIEHVALFDEAQRAWNIQQTANFMRRKKHLPNFNVSEPEFLISCLDRHPDWAVIVCLVGGGQEINTGEAGIREWIEALNRTFNGWNVFISPQLTDSEYGAGKVIDSIKSNNNLVFHNDLHLSVSMRSFRSENVSLLVKQILDLNAEEARKTLKSVNDNYPIVITRDLSRAKKWLRDHARGSERFGIVASSQAFRLKPYAVDVRTTIDPIHWFLDTKEDVRSSYYLEDVATEFQIQGLEVDWACVIWDGDFRFSKNAWEYKSFCGDRWNQIKKAERQNYLKNAYRVLLTRARQGMVIVVPPGDSEDKTRKPEYYDPVFNYLESLGFPII